MKNKDLTTIALRHKADKAGVHSYTPHYMTHFAPFEEMPVNLLEIGVGGYSNPKKGGNSLRMWKEYFEFGKIFSVDIYDKSAFEEERIRIFTGSQVDRDFMEKVVKEMGTVDLIIDDGSHENKHVIDTFQILFPHLRDGGIYVIEDTQTAYWEDFGGGRGTKHMMAFFQDLTNGMNYKEFIFPGYVPSYFDRKIVSMHFYHNLIFVYKGDNNEESNVIKNNTKPDHYLNPNNKR